MYRQKVNYRVLSIHRSLDQKEFNMFANFGELIGRLADDVHLGVSFGIYFRDIKEELEDEG